jgi:hypothetical protein
MIKRVNFTGRRRIPRTQVHIEVHDGKPRTFDAVIELDVASLPPHAGVFLEAMCAGSTVIERFDCGLVERLKPLQRRQLREVEGENVFFTLKVIDRSERFGRILGIAENIRPERSGKQTAAGRRGILPIEPRDLGEELWRLEWREHDVYLLVNNQVPGLVDRSRGDPLFYALVYPEVVRSVLRRAIEENVDLNGEDDGRWPTLWQRFGRQLHPQKSEPPKPDDAQEDRDEWVDEVVQAFCDSHQMKTKYLTTCDAAGDDR